MTQWWWRRSDMCAYAPYDCDNVALWWVTHHNTNRTLHVCSDHRDARLYDGWELTDMPVKAL